MYTESQRREVAASTGRAIERVRFVAINNHLDVDDLVIMLEIVPEDLLDRFEDKMYEHKEKFIPDGYCDTDIDIEDAHSEVIEEGEITDGND